MMGATLSRWTMAYFAAALLSLETAEILMTFGFGFPSAAVIAPDTLALVHLVTVGWLSLAICGALFQFVPVLAAAPRQDEGTSMVVLVLLVTGLIALVCGFLQLGGRIDLKFPLLTTAAVLLGGGFSLVVRSLALTLWKARPLPLPARFVGLGIASVAATVALGAVDVDRWTNFEGAPHQFRTRNDLNETQQTRSKANKNTANSTKPIVILSLITVWLQVRVLPCRAHQQINHLSGLHSASVAVPHQKRRVCGSSLYFNGPQTTARHSI
jgi:hypothetical protein